MNRVFFAAVGLTLVPFGSLEVNLTKKNPWRGSDIQDAVILSARAEKVPLEPGISCLTWLKALADSPGGLGRWDGALSGWQPFEPAELKAVQECDRFPCEVKLDETEAVKMSATPSARRKDVFQGLVRKRTEAYIATGARREYELPGAPIDPWTQFLVHGFVTDLPLPEVPSLRVRTLNIAPHEMKPVRQVLDRRHAESAREGVVWVRDVYENHHLDAMGEWLRVDCGEPGSTEVRVVQAFILELDQLKKRDVLSLLARSKIRNAVTEQAARYLDREFIRISLKVQDLRALPPSSAPSRGMMPTELSK